jgi:hypothetical protein
MRRTERWVVAPPVIWSVGALLAQDRIKTMPGCQCPEDGAPDSDRPKSGALVATWTDGGNAIEYRTAGVIDSPRVPSGDRRQDAGQWAERTRTASAASTRTGRRRQFVGDVTGRPVEAFYRGRNLWLSAADGTNEARSRPTVRSDAGEVRHRELGVRRGTRAADCHVVVAG